MAAPQPIANPPADPPADPIADAPKPPAKVMLSRLQIWDDHEQHPLPPTNIRVYPPPPDTTHKAAKELFGEFPDEEQAYGANIDIDKSFKDPTKGVNGATAAQSLDHLVAYIHESKVPETNGQGHAWANELEIHQKLRILHDYFTQRPGRNRLDAELLEHADNVWAYLKKRRPLENLRTIPRVRYPDDPADIVFSTGDRRISVWNGDITHLPVTAIVNAANPSLQGCTILGHECIDYAIHTAAGPRLREDCHRIRAKMGDQAIGGCKITRGYFLHARYVLHTVGPIVSGGKPTEEQEDQLASCYVACLRLAEKLPARSYSDGVSIAFCGISIGEYGFPKDRAAQIAIQVVQEYFDGLGDKSRINRVIFNVFDKRDMVHYRPLLNKNDVLAPYAFPDYDTSPHMPSVCCAADSIARATFLVIACGAGLSQSMGLRNVDYYSPETLRRAFNPLSAGFPKDATIASMLRHKFTDPLEKWAFYGLLSYHVMQSERKDKTRTVYDVLGNMAHIVGASSPKHEFLITTTNWDFEWYRSFLKLNYQNAGVVFLHGHLGALHCPKLCGPVISGGTFFTLDWFKRINPKTGKLSSTKLVPRCTTCNGELEFAIHLNPPIDPHFTKSEKTMLERLKAHAGDAVMLEIGAGFDTPDAMRYRNEELVEKGVVRTLIRMNLDGDEELPWEWTDCTRGNKEKNITENTPRGISLKADATVGVQWLAAAIRRRHRQRKEYAELQIVSHAHKRTYLDDDAGKNAEQARKRRRII